MDGNGPLDREIAHRLSRIEKGVKETLGHYVVGMTETN